MTKVRGDVAPDGVALVAVDPPLPLFEVHGPVGEGCLMRNVGALTPLHDALADLELAAALVLLAEQESTPIGHVLPRLSWALSAVHSARGLEGELVQTTGRPMLRVLDGSPPLPGEPDVAYPGSPGTASLRDRQPSEPGA